MNRRALTSIALIAALGVSATAVAQTEPRPLERMWKRIMAELEAASASLEPKRTPPKPVKVRWGARRIAPIDLKAPVLAIAIADLDGDNKAAELVVLTTREVAVLKLVVRTYRRGNRVIHRYRWHKGARFALPGPPARIAPRDPVGALIVANVDDDPALEVLARASTRAKGVVLELKQGSLIEQSRFDGFPLCVDTRAQLAEGRNYFVANAITWPDKAERPVMPARFYSAACVNGLVDAKGRPLHAFGRVDTSGLLSVRYAVDCGRHDEACSKHPTSELSLKGVGTAWAVADVNNDGVPELITSSTSAPGARDRVSVHSGTTRLARRYARRFVGGVVGLAAGDIDGDGDRDVLAAVRLLGATSIGLWALNR